MFTFLFDDYRAHVKGIYKSRFTTIYAFMFGILFTVGVVLTIPTYILLDSRLSAAQIEKNAVVTPPGETSAAVDQEVSTIKQRISIIQTDSTEVPFGTILERLLSKKGDDIRFDGIAIRRGGETGSISISGIAPSRDALVNLSKRLQGEPTFSNVNLPVGSLTRSKDVPFSITIETKI